MTLLSVCKHFLNDKWIFHKAHGQTIILKHAVLIDVLDKQLLQEYLLFSCAQLCYLSYFSFD